MDIPQLTPQRQKMLVGAAAAGLLLILGFSFAPDLELADQSGTQEVNEVLALVDEERATAPTTEEVPAPRPFRRARMLAQHSITDAAPEPERDEPQAITPPEKSRALSATTSETAHVIPPSYQQRLALLAEEEEALIRHQRRQRDAASGENLAPAPTVTIASADADDDATAGVEQALAQSRQPGRLRRVELIDGNTEVKSMGPAVESRGARLSGVIEVD